MEDDIMKDVKKYQQAEKLKKWRDETQPIPWYYDGLENLSNRLHPLKQVLHVTDIQSLSHDTKLYRLVSARADQPLAPFRAGQYVGITLDINGVRTTRPYSIVSSPNQLAYYELGIRRKEGGFVSSYIFNELKVGDIIEATEPLGTLYYNPLFNGKELVFIAGGCGVTPFISLLRYISEKALNLKVWLIFGCVTEEDILFREELEDIASRRSNIKIHYVLSEPGPEWKGDCGFITEEIISSKIGSIGKKYFYIVGNRAMHEFIKKELENLGVPQQRMKFEAFGVPDDITQIIGWPGTLDHSSRVKIRVHYFKSGMKTEKTFEAPCTEPLLNSLEREMRSELQLRSACRSGECAFCRTKLISGKVFSPPEVVIREVDQAIGFIHPCISYPISDLELDLTMG
ncbi:MAG: flavin reductase family protein [Promethearchaeota archaeon]